MGMRGMGTLAPGLRTGMRALKEGRKRTWMQALKDGRVIFRKTSEGDRTRLVPRGDTREVAEAGIAAARRAKPC